MLEKHMYLLPDYFEDFRCKMGACRASCCEKWPVSLSRADYFRLLSVPCRKPLRQRLDAALHIRPDAAPDRYAELSHRFDGACPMRLPDGRCALHAEQGEGALPAVCRLYPRAVRSEGEWECSCAASCEGVVERLLRREDPIAFVRRELALELPESDGASVYRERRPDEQAERMRLIAILQQRTRPLPERIMRLGGQMLGRDVCLPPGSPLREHLVDGLHIMESILAKLDEYSDNLHDYGEAALAFFAGGGKMERYREGRARFEGTFPRWEAAYENLLVNHMFFSRFPFSDEGEGLEDEFIALCLLYSLMRFLGVGLALPDESAWVDALAAAFRMIDHTPFHQYAPRLLHRMERGTMEQMRLLLAL